MSKHGMADAELEAIELRLLGADHRPWATDVRIDGSKHIYMASSRDLVRSIVRTKKELGAGAENAVRGSGAQRAAVSSTLGDLTLLKPTDHVTPEMCEFVAQAPEDIEKLLREVKLQRSRADKLEEKADRLAASFKDAIRDRDRITERLRTVVRHWHLFQEALGAEVLP